MASTGNYALPLQGVAVMVLVAAGIFTLVDCTKGFDHKIAPEKDPVAA